MPEDSSANGGREGETLQAKLDEVESRFVSAHAEAERRFNEGIQEIRAKLTGKSQAEFNEIERGFRAESERAKREFYDLQSSMRALAGGSGGEL